MFDAITLLAICCTFLLAGGVKGVIGLGLPTVSLGLLTVILDLPTAMALLIAPSFVTNIWQALSGRHLRALILRLWPFLLTALITITISASGLRRFDLTWLTMLLGGLLVVYALLSLSKVSIQIPVEAERWAGPLAGATNGILTGLTGSFVVPGVLYLQAIELPRDAFIQAMGLLFSVSTIALAIALQRNGFMSADIGIASTMAVIPAIAGMLLGQKFRQSVSATQFRNYFYLGILLMGVYILARV